MDKEDARAISYCCLSSENYSRKDDDDGDNALWSGMDLEAFSLFAKQAEIELGIRKFLRYESKQRR